MISPESVCDFEKIDEGWRCRRCGYLSLKEVYRNCRHGNLKPVPMAAKDYPCEHRGEFLRIQHCGLCGGPKEVSVYECEIHEECAMRPMKRQTGRVRVACCVQCDDRLEKGG